MLGAMAGPPRGSWLVAFLQLLGGAAFLGAVIDGLLLGHWYLTDRGLTRRPINRTTWPCCSWGSRSRRSPSLIGGFGSFGSRPDRPRRSSAHPHVGGSGVVDRDGDGRGTTALIAVIISATLVGHTALGRPVGDRLFYLAVITALTAELAAKVKFLP